MSFNESTINCIRRVYPVVEADAGARAAALSAEPFPSWQGLPEPAAAQAAAAEGEAVGSAKSGFHLCSEAGLSLLPGQVSIIKQASLAASIVCMRVFCVCVCVCVFQSCAKQVERLAHCEKAILQMKSELERQ